MNEVLKINIYFLTTLFDTHTFSQMHTCKYLSRLLFDTLVLLIMLS